MSTGLMRAECRKFVPNIFNKTKCSNCFRQKEEHSAEALECNRATRKISKCGYLFVAPGWDFSNPLNRTKRWQRRWFVLYDDGELSYSVDEHPETVPQASIDMNKVLEVSDAEEITGNSYSLAITAPETVHFVKGTCREEAKWWKDVLNVFPRSKGRHKRNATFPGSQTTTILQQSSLSCRSATDSRPRFNSYHTDGLLRTPSSPQWLHVEEEEDIFPTRDIKISTDAAPESPPTSIDPRQSYSPEVPNPENRTIYRDHQPISSTSPPTRDKIHTEEKARTRRTLNREKRGLKTGRSYTEELYSSTKSEEVFGDNFTSIKNSRNLSDGITNILREGKAGDTNEVARRILFETEKSKREEKLKDIADSITRPRTRRHTQTMLSSYERHSSSQVKPTRDGDYSEEEKGSISPVVGGADDVDNQIEKPIRGDPDGCGLDLTSQRYSPSSELRVDLPAEDLLNIKKGWLMKQGNGQEWTKHWFVLRGAALMYYRDPTAEDKGILDGVMDLSSVNNVTEIQVQRNYGFQTISWDDRRYILSAVTAGIRSNWMTAIRKAAGIPEPVDISLTLGEKLERELERSSSESNNPQYFESKHSSSRNSYLDSGIQRTSSSQYLESSRSSSSQYESPSRSSSSSISIPRSPSSQYVENFLQKSSNSQFSDGAGVKRSSSAQSVVTDRNFHFSSDDDYRTASEGSRKENDDWNDATPTPLPPSPPLNRTPISRVKERAKTQTSRSRVYNKRSKSSPPTSRRNTLDSIRTEDVMAVEKSAEPIKRSIILDKVDRHLKEIDELKGQLNLALCERSTAEKELTRLRQRKTETNLQMEELLRTLKLTEDELKLKNQELEDFDNLKQRYNKLMKEHEGVLTSYRENALNDDWRKMYQQLKEEYANDKRSWDAKLENATNMLQAATERCEMLTRELTASEETVEALKMELSNLSERLMRGIEENEGLYGRMRELEGRCLSASRERGRSVDSLSDLTNIDLDIDLDNLDKERVIEEYEELKGRFEKAIQEIRAMKRELRESHACYDDLELTVINLRQDSKRKEENDKAQAALMASRIEDLTLKLTASEKQCRTLKQKISKSESREKRRSLSLKGGESFQISREVEEKLAELEAKINALEQGKPIASVVIKTATSPVEKEVKSKKEDLRSARLRRKSLDSATGSEPMKVLIRLSSLESKIAKFGNKKQPEVKILDEDGSETLGKAISKLQECRSLMASMKSSRRPSSPLNSKSFASIEGLLLEVESILANYEDPTPKNEEVKKSVECVVYKLESLLSAKLTELMEKRRKLSEVNQLDEEAKLKLLAERLAYESILIKKIKEAVEDFKIDGNHCKNLAMRSEIQETNRLISLVRKKIKGEDVNLNENSLDYLTKALTEALVSEGDLMTDVRKMRRVLSEASPESDVNLHKLLENQRSLHNLVEGYKKEKLETLAKSLATETLCLTAEYEQGRKNNSSEDRRIREAWTLAQEALNKELVQAEISHVTMRCASLYEANAAKDLEANLTLIAEEYKNHEEYVRQVEDCLRKVIDTTVDELTSEYEKYLNKLKYEKHLKTTEQLEEESRECRTLMENFVSVLAQKTLIDTRIQVLTKNPCCDRTGVDRRPVVRGVCLKSDANLEARFIYLYQKFSAECLQSVEQVLESRQDLSEAVEALNNCAVGVNKLREALKLEGSRLDDNCESNWSSVRDKCTSLKMEVEDIVKCLQGDKNCTRCDVLEDTLHKMEAQYDEEIQILRHCHEKEMQDLRGELESQRDSLVCQHEHEQAQLMERARRLERRLGTLDAEYAQQMDNLRAAYHKTLSAELEKDENTEDSIRQRYQSEIEQLRALCEKGLIAVDNSHRRIIAELEEKHRQELAAAAAEKEQALAEETQATLAALDAMRKAHETEVQKEINKFKTEFLKKMQSNHDIHALHKEHEEEMEEIKKEILSLSEKYSIKCVESASLEEQLGLVSKQLSQAQQHIMQLDARNKQLRAHLVSEAVQLDDFEATCPRSLKSEEDDKNHGTTRQAHSLDEFRRSRSSENSPPSREPLSLDRYFNKQTWSSKAGGKTYLAEKSGNENAIKDRATRWQEPTTLTRAELLRSPKCSLFATTNFNSPSLSQLSGMVAERKKLFEH